MKSAAHLSVSMDAATTAAATTRTNNTRPTAAHEPEGYEYIAFIGQITTLETDDESFGLWEQAPRIPFGFQAPEPVVVEVDAPALTSQDWAAWLGEWL